VSGRSYKILILDHDPDVLTHLQHVLEDGGLDTTITWDCVEARELTRNTPFDVILVGNHSPEVAAETFLRAPRPARQACMLLGASDSKSEPLRRLGITAVVPKQEPHRVLQAVQEHLRRKRPVSDRGPQLDAGRLHQSL
jgi:DNA-binding response OmpR family regulator